jgi:D-glycero-D-manno-heptose 1,7-bisphosphate phosphatase
LAGKGAIFLDRDGTLNELALNPATGDWESPHRPEEVRPAPGLAEAMALLAAAKKPLFVVSNQPSAAKGKCSLDDLAAVHQSVQALVEAGPAKVTQWYYCYHHPQGIVPTLCECRKPGTLFLREASRDHGVDLAASWFIGDQDFDVRCGRDAGCRTIVIENPRSAGKRGKERADHSVASLLEAAKLVAS